MAMDDPNATFTDLCEQLRRARRQHHALLQKAEAAKQHAKDCESAQQAAVEACEAAQVALDRFIDRECEVTS